MKWKTYAQVIGIICALTLAAHFGLQVNDVTLSAGQVLDATNLHVGSTYSLFTRDYSYIIAHPLGDNSLYCLQNGTSGVLDKFGTNKAYIEGLAIGNLTALGGGSIYLKEITLDSSLTYGSAIAIYQQYQGQFSYYSNNALVYSAKSGSFNATTVHVGVLNASTGYVQTYRLLVENGSSYPSSPSSGYFFFRTDLNSLTYYNGTDWTLCAGGGSAPVVDDDSMYLLISSATNFLFQNGTRPLTANWNVGGSHGIYGAVWLNTTNINLGGNIYFNGGQAVNMTLWRGSTFPASAISGQPFYRTDRRVLYVYNGTGWANAGVELLTDSLGYATQGSGGATIEDNIVGSVFTCADKAHATSVTAYLAPSTLYNQQAKAAIYLHSDLSLIGNTSETAVIAEVGWYTFAFATYPSLSAGTDYVLAVWGEAGAGSCTIPYGTGSTDQGHTQALTYSGSFPNPMAPAHNTLKYSIYCNYTIDTTGTLNTIYCTTISALDSEGVKVLDFVVENGTSFPSSPIDRQVFFRGDEGYLYVRNNSLWQQVGTTLYSNLTGKPDLTVYLTKDGATALTGNWNIGGSFGVYGATWLNTTNINLVGDLYFNRGQSINMTFWSGASWPALPIAGQPFYRTDLSILYYYNGTYWASVTAGATGPAGPTGTVLGLPYSYLVFSNATATYMVNGTDNTAPYSNSNATKVEQFALGNMTNGLLCLKEVQHNASLTLTNTQVIMQQYQGAIQWFNNQGKVLLTQLSADPDTSLWSTVQAGYLWYNTAADTIKYWNGTGVVILPSIGGGSTSSYTLPYTYTIYKTGSTYYSQKYDGTIYSSTNATLVWQYAIDNMTTGTMFAKAGTYTLDQIIPKSSITIRGEGNSTFLVQRSGSNKDLFKTTTTIECFQISDFRLSGSTVGNTVGNLFNFTCPRRCIFEKLVIDDVAEYAFFLAGAPGSYGYYNTIRDCQTISANVGFLFVRWCDENTIENNVIGGCKEYGLNLWAGLNHIYGNSFVAGSLGQLDLYMGYEAGNVVIGNTFDTASSPVAGKRHAIRIQYSALEGAVITGNDFNNQGNSTQSTIYVTDSANVIVSDNTFRGTSLPKYVVEINSAKNFSMQGNTFDCGYTTGVFGKIGTTTGLQISYNVGFVTENTVLNAGNTTVTTFVFNHGLASTANSVQVSFNFTGWTSWTWTSTSTQVTVTVTGTLPAAMKILAADVKYIP